MTVKNFLFQTLTVMAWVMLANLVGGCLVNLLVFLFPALEPSNLLAAEDLIKDTSTWVWWIVSGSVVIISPLIEELFFRGFLWWIIKKLTKSVNVTWISTSVLFALAHLEPAHILGVLPLAFLFGYVRKKYDSLSINILTHSFNNLFAVIWMLIT